MSADCALSAFPRKVSLTGGAVNGPLDLYSGRVYDYPSLGKNQGKLRTNQPQLTAAEDTNDNGNCKCLDSCYITRLYSRLNASRFSHTYLISLSSSLAWATINQFWYNPALPATMVSNHTTTPSAAFMVLLFFHFNGPDLLELEFRSLSPGIYEEL